MLKSYRAFTLYAVLIIVALTLLISVPNQVRAASSITVNGGTTHQVIDGFGASDHFGIASLIKNMSSASTIMNDLFSPTTGAGLTIVRNGIGPSSIEPNSPGSPSTAPTYTWDGSDSQQVWFSQQALSLGATTVYADAWTAPAFMKTNGTIANGGFLCGESGSGAPTCSSGDWRQAYANMLTQYAKDYASAGINLAYIGYINEPDFTASYDSMNFDATQVSAGNRGTLDSTTPQDIDFIKNYLGPTLKASGLNTKVSCCDATSWDHVATYTAGILKDSTASSYLALVTGHAYYGSPNGLINSPITTNGQHVWETETSTFDSWITAWDDGSDASGFTWASNLWSALTQANVNGFLYWWFAENNSSNSDNEGLININGSSFTVSARLWAFANYSRYIHPGATRIDATTSDGNIKVSAFKNTDGTIAVVALNGNTSDTPVSVSLSSVGSVTQVVPVLTNASNNAAPQAATVVSAGVFSGTIPARSLVTYVISPNGSGPTVTPTIAVSPTVGPSATPSKTNTPVPTNTTGPTATTGPTNTPNPGGNGLTVSIDKGGGTDNTQETTFNFQIKNSGTSAASSISARIYFTLDGSNAASGYMMEKYYDQSGVATISGPTLACGSTYYFTVGYGSASLGAGASWEFQTALHLTSWGSTYDGSNDWYHTGYAVGALPASYTSTNYIPAYANGTLVWGSTPSCGGATNTPAATNTFVPPPSSTPVPATKTNTPIPTTGPSSTPAPTKTNTPVPTTGPSATPVPATKTNTPVATSSGNCTPTSTISAPFTFDGAGTFCWKTNSLGSYINSWNLASLTINGANITNVYVASSSYPAKASDGYWYISYNSTVSYGHFETK